MTSKQLTWIKKAQQQFKDEFGQTLHIDWRSMKGMPPHVKTIKQTTVIVEKVEVLKVVKQVKFVDKTFHLPFSTELIDDFAKIYGIDLNDFRQKVVLKTKGRHLLTLRETLFMQALAELTFSNKWNPKLVGQHLNRHRSVIYYYLDINEKRRKLKANYKRKKAVKENLTKINLEV